jgi:hypothetical protein
VFHRRLWRGAGVVALVASRGVREARGGGAAGGAGEGLGLRVGRAQEGSGEGVAGVGAGAARGVQAASRRREVRTQ